MQLWDVEVVSFDCSFLCVIGLIVRQESSFGGVPIMPVCREHGTPFLLPEGE